MARNRCATARFRSALREDPELPLDTLRGVAWQAAGRPLAWHLGLLCAALLIPVIALEAFLLVAMATTERAQHQAAAREAARRTAVVLDRRLATLGGMAEVLASSDHVMADDFDAFRQRILQLPRPTAAQFVIRDAAGQVLMATGDAAVGDRDLDAETAARQTTRTQFTGVLRQSPSREPVFAIISPVPDQGAMRDRLLTLRVPVIELGDLIRKEGIPPGMTASITDRNGTVVARSSDGQLVGARPARSLPPQEPEGWQRGTDLAGRPIVLAFARSEVAGWTAWVFMPAGAFAAPLRRSLLASAAVAIVFAALAAILAMSFARRITRPISRLAEAAARGGDAALPTPVREVNALASAYGAARREANRLREAQGELRHVARLNEMGTLAATLAHEINQPLTAAATFSEAAIRLLGTEAAQPTDLTGARGAMRQAADQALHAGRIVRGLRDFLAHGGERTSTDLNGLVREGASLALADRRNRGISPRFALEPALPPVTVDRVQIAQVVVNLVRNAADALEAAARRELVVATRHAGSGNVEVSVADSGEGIAPEVASRLFSPFVTTKPGGMGVGLAIARSIVEEHGGRLEVAPNAGGGSVFRFTLPVPGLSGAPCSQEAITHAG
ncbi:sensor histidine kinase [Falsiroseomonas sp. HW251]|uniref:sensor histidine kinase n=1 Tax=Falsiroseomonas sp. HW251 TaxID=3390998 RepID=UPI003D31368E